MNFQYQQQRHPHQNRFINQELFNQQQRLQQHSKFSSHSPSAGKSPIIYQPIQGKLNTNFHHQNSGTQQHFVHRPPSRPQNVPPIIFQRPSFHQTNIPIDHTLKPQSVKQMETIVRNSRIKQNNQSGISHINISGDPIRRNQRQIYSNHHQPHNIIHQTSQSHHHAGMQENRRSHTQNNSNISEINHQFYQSNSLPKKPSVISNQIIKDVSKEESRNHNTTKHHNMHQLSPMQKINQQHRTIVSHQNNFQREQIAPKIITQPSLIQNYQNHQNHQNHQNQNQHQGVMKIKQISQIQEVTGQNKAGKILKVYSSYDQYLNQKKPIQPYDISAINENLSSQVKQERNSIIIQPKTFTNNARTITLYEPSHPEELSAHESDQVLQHELNSDDEACDFNQEEQKYRRNRSNNSKSSGGVKSHISRNNSQSKNNHSSSYHQKSQISKNDQSKQSWTHHHNHKNIIKQSNHQITHNFPPNFNQNGKSHEQEYMPANRSEKSQSMNLNKQHIQKQRQIKAQLLKKSRSSGKSDFNTKLQYRQPVTRLYQQSNNRNKDITSNISYRQLQHQRNVDKPQNTYEVQSFTHLTHNTYQNAEDDYPRYEGSIDIISIINSIYDKQKLMGVEKIRKIYSRLTLV